jgi:hypothetical protein
MGGLLPGGNPISTVYGLFNPQLHNLVSLTKQVLQISQATMALSGLNLVVSALGFAFLSRKLKDIEDQLKEIAKDVKAIRELLERRERAELRVALRELEDIEKIRDSDHRHTLLHNARRTFLTFQESYQEMLVGAKTPEDAIAVEEHLALVALCQSRCLAEMEQVDMAGRDLQKVYIFWQEHVQRIARRWLQEKKGQRVIYRNFADEVSAPAFLEWLDFAAGTPRGLEWMDDLRRASAGKKDDVNKKERKQIEKISIPFMQQVVARNKVFDGYVAQYDLMAAQNMSLKQFIGTIEDLRKKMELGVDEMLVLTPEEQ